MKKWPYQDVIQCDHSIGYTIAQQLPRLIMVAVDMEGRPMAFKFTKSILYHSTLSYKLLIIYLVFQVTMSLSDYKLRDNDSIQLSPSDTLVT